MRLKSAFTHWSSLASLNCRNQHCNSTDGQVPPDDHTKLICTVALWVYPLAAHRSFFVCARKLAQKYTSLPACVHPLVVQHVAVDVVLCLMGIHRQQLPRAPRG
jgi:hypothetical protein